MAAGLVEVALTPFVFLLGNIQSYICVERRESRGIAVYAEIAALFKHAGGECRGNHTGHVGAFGSE